MQYLLLINGAPLRVYKTRAAALEGMLTEMVKWRGSRSTWQAIESNLFAWVGTFRWSDSLEERTYEVVTVLEGDDE